MKNITKAFCITGIVAMVASTTSAQAYSGIFGFGLELNTNAALATDHGTTLYNFTGSDSRIVPTGSTATVSGAWAQQSDGNNPSYNLGTFTTADSLTFKGGVLLSYDGSGDFTSSATLDYSLSLLSDPRNGNFTAVNLPFNANPTANSSDIRWSTESQTTNLLTGLAAGTYRLELFGFDAINNANQFNYINGDGNNYAATFTVVNAPIGAVPEPSTYALLGAGCVGLVLVMRNRRASLKA